MESFLGLSVNTIYFPDMQSLLVWSRSPKLSEYGVTLISGSERVISVLRGIISTRHVMLTGSYDSLAHIKAELHLRLINATVTEEHSKYIRFTSLEMEHMWSYIRGSNSGCSADEKRNSRIRRRVMEKIGADNIVSLVVRFRLLFALDEKFLQLHIKMRGSSLLNEKLDLNSGSDIEVITSEMTPTQYDKLSILHR